MSERYEVRISYGRFWVVRAVQGIEVFFCDCDRHEENAQRIAAAVNRLSELEEELAEEVKFHEATAEQRDELSLEVLRLEKAQAGVAAFFPNRLPDVDASDSPTHWYHKGWNDCRTQALHARAPQPQASAEDVALVSDVMGLLATHADFPSAVKAWQRIRADHERMGVVK